MDTRDIVGQESPLGVVVEDRVIARAQASGLILDPAQRQILAELAGFVGGVGSAGESDPVGVYLHGPAGRGKTWIARAVFDALPGDAVHKRRVHFHTFFQQLMQRFGTMGSARHAIEDIVTELLAETRWFFFDELHVHDPGGASLLNRLLAEIVERGTPTLVTSNYEPSGLLPNPVYHHVFAPGIALLEERFRILRLDAGVDYRERAPAERDGFAAGRWVVAADDEGARAAGLVPPSDAERTEVTSGPYRFVARAVRGGTVWFDARELLESASTPQDYLGWLGDFDRWVLAGLPPLSALSREARQRLVGLIDVLSDAGVPLTVISTVAPAALVDVDEVPPDLFRARSRLALLAVG